MDTREVSVPMGAFLIYKGEDLFMEQENVIITGKDLEHFEMFQKTEKMRKPRSVNI